MAEFRIRRADILKKFVCNMSYVATFDGLVAQQANGTPDLVYPNGWTEQDSIALYRVFPIGHNWLIQQGLVPVDNVQAAFPRRLKGQALLDYVLPKLPSEMTPEDRKKLVTG